MSKKTNKGNLAQLTEPAKGSSPSGFVARASLPSVKGIVVKSMSPILKPSQWPQVDDGTGKMVNAVLVGVFTKIFPTKEFKRGKETVIGLGAEIVPVGAPVGVALPVTATLKTGLDIKGEGDEATSEFLGRVVEIELMPEKIPSKKGNAAWHFAVGIHPTDTPLLKN